MTLWLWSYFPKLAPPMNKNPEHTCYGLHYTDIRGPRYAFGAYFKFFYHELTSMGKSWMPFARDAVPWWLKQSASNPGDDYDDHMEVWTSFLISRDLMYGMAYVPTNYKCAVEYYNAAQFARQFGLCQLTPIPPYQSLNEDFTDRPVIQPRDLERVRNVLPEHRKDFALHSFVERTEKGAKFDNWWGGYIKMHFSKPYLDVLTALLPNPAEAPEPGIHMPLQQISPSPSQSTKRKGLSDVLKDVPSAPQRSKRVKTTAQRQWPKASETAVAGRIRSSAKTSSPETDPSENATSKTQEEQAESVPSKKKRLQKKTSTLSDSEKTESATEHNPIVRMYCDTNLLAFMAPYYHQLPLVFNPQELDAYLEEEILEDEVEIQEKGLEVKTKPEHEASSRTPEKHGSPAIHSSQPLTRLLSKISCMY
ncbi:hypothetical protein RHMOL_Rhmol05G0170100 [Rhododendron molle]|uniref:Uncharacterized protein n=1 Tax=Rhododendron molle TaxID=49168 RepID=A0ACC0NQZ3_RHOML|nr:hypothetical protein RHMOL_Rhmol05G0170100 [Rhododendron molle]